MTDKNDFKKQGFCTVFSLCVTDHGATPLVFIGIIVLVLLGLACIAAGFYIWRRRRQATGKSEFVFSLSVL